MEDDNFYSQIASSLADNSFDDSDDDDKAKPTQSETKQLAQSVDVDDMDASLFSSLSSGQSMRRSSRRGSRSRAPSTTQAEVETAGSVGASGEGVSVGVSGEGREDGAVSLRRDRENEKKGPPKEETEKKKPKFDFEDEILDLLSDGEDMAPKTRTKPKIKLSIKKPKPQEPTNTDSNPITSPTEGLAPSGNELERPSTSRGLPTKEKEPSTIETVTKATPTQVPVKEGGADVLKVETSKKKTNDSKNTVTFDDDDEDILGGMGFDDEKTPSKPKTTTPTSRLDNLLGTNKSSKAQSKSRPSSRTEETEVKSANGEGEDGSLQFGGYVPSSIGGSGGPTRRGSLKLPSGRRRGSSELDSSVMDRPSTAPSPVRKSVHFAENLEMNERPASSSTVVESRRSSLRSEKNLPPSPGKQSVKTTPPSPSKQSQKPLGEEHDGKLPSRKPSLPVKAEQAMESGGGGLKEDDVMLSDSLFAMDTEISKQPTGSQGRRRPPSRSSSTPLFENNPPSNSGTGLVSGGDNQESNPPDKLSTSREPTKLPVRDTDKLEHPVFPWQKPGGGSSLSRSSGKRHSSSSVDTNSTETPTAQRVQNSMNTNELSLNQNTVLSSFQEQLLQQQRLVQEQMASFQAQSNSAIATAKASSAAEIERLRGELESATGGVRELEELVEKNNVEISDKQKSIKDLEQKLSTSEEVRHQLEDQCKELTNKLGTTDKEMAQVKQEMSSQIEELKVKLYRIELERDQLHHASESMAARHKEELEAIQKSHESRASAMEESIQRRETRWREETAADAARFQEKITSLEQEKTDVVISLKKKLDALEISKTNEIGRLKDLHYSAIEELKREHELDKQHLLGLHRQELEAVKAAHSHTRMLSDLSHKVEVSTRDMTHLQAKLEHAHSTELDERTQRVKSHEEHLKALETQLMRQKSENNAERDQLQSLIAKMESHVSQQKKQIEHERWQLQQDTAKLTAQQSAFEEERASSLMKLESERERLEQAKEKFLTEQQEILSQCYEERRTIASERAELSVQQKRASEREQRDKQLSVQSEAERETVSAALREESERLMTERTQLRREQEQLRLDREAADRDREKLEVYGAEIQQRSLEMEHITETAMLVREKGDQSLAESQRLQEELSQQAQAIQSQREELAEKEKLLAIEQLSLAQERRKLQHLKVMSLSSSAPERPSEETVDKSATNPLLLGRDALEPQESLLSVSNTSLSSYRGGVSGGLSASANRSYSPRASPLHTSALSGPPNVKSVLARIDQSRSLRQLVLDAKKDDEYLEQETSFLQSLQSNAYIY